MNTTNPTLVVIPVKNEDKTIESVVKSVLESSACAVVVIDDASTDDTARAAKNAGACVLPLALHSGAWIAIQTGL